MENQIESILATYCTRQGINLQNKEQVIRAIESVMDNVIPFIVSEVGLLEEETVK